MFYYGVGKYCLKIAIWKGYRFRVARDLLQKNSRTINSCKSCDVEGTLIGKKHAILWEEYYGNK